MAALWIVILTWLVAVSCDSGSASYIHSQERMNEGHEKGPRKIGRHRRETNCDSLLKFAENGYRPLKIDDVEIDFLLLEENKHVARVKWKPPAIQNATAVDGFLLTWDGNLYSDDAKCTFLNNKTTTYDITPWKKWKYDHVLHIIIYPIPIAKGIGSTPFLQFTPKYQVIHHTTPVPNVTEKITYQHRTNNTTNTAYSDTGHHDEYSSKLIIGSVIGVAIAVVLIIIFVKSYSYIFPPSSHKETYYISYYPESKEFVKEVKQFAYWLLENGFDVQMLTEENDMLTKRNLLRRMELARFMFREFMVKSSDKVFLILSPVYLELCTSSMGEDDAINQNFSEEEKLVNGEIVQIRWELNENMYRSRRFVPICFRRIESASIPFWIKELVFFSWPEDKTNQKLLNWLNGLPEYPSNNGA